MGLGKRISERGSETEHARIYPAAASNRVPRPRGIQVMCANDKEEYIIIGHHVRWVESGMNSLSTSFAGGEMDFRAVSFKGSIDF